MGMLPRGSADDTVAIDVRPSTRRGKSSRQSPTASGRGPSARTVASRSGVLLSCCRAECHRIACRKCMTRQIAAVILRKTGTRSRNEVES